MQLGQQPGGQAGQEFAQRRQGGQRDGQGGQVARAGDRRGRARGQAFEIENLCQPGLYGGAGLGLGQQCSDRLLALADSVHRTQRVQQAVAETAVAHACF